MEGTWREGKRTYTSNNCFTAYHSGKLWLFCDTFYSLQSYDPILNTWTVNTVDPNLSTSYGLAAINGVLYISANEGFYTYTILSDQWDFINVPNSHTSFLVYSDESKIFYALTETQLYSYNTETGEYKELAPLPISNKYSPFACGCTILGDNLYYISTHGDKIQIYNIPTNTWSTQNLGFNCYFCDLCAFDNKLALIIGAGSATKALFKIYEPNNETWVNGPDIPFPIEDCPYATVVSDSIYVIDRYGFVQIFGPEPSGATHTITLQFLSTQGAPIQSPVTRTAGDGQPFTAAAPSIAGYACAGFRIDGGELQSGSTAVIPAVDADHTVTFVYKADDGTDPGPGPGPNPGADGECCPCVPELNLRVPISKCNADFIRDIADALKRAPTDCCGC